MTVNFDCNHASSSISSIDDYAFTKSMQISDELNENFALVIIFDIDHSSSSSTSK